MEASDVSRAVAAATSIAKGLDLAVDDASVLQSSNKLALRLLPCDVLARVAHVGREVALLEVELAQRLAESESPLAALDPRIEPRVHVRDGFVVTLWTYYEPVAHLAASPAAYASTLARLHAGMRKLDVMTPHFTDRVGEAQHLVASRDDTPALDAADRQLLGDTLSGLRRTIGDRRATAARRAAPRQRAQYEGRAAVHNLETCCRGPVEFDLAHVPEAVSERYPNVDQTLLRNCRGLVLAMVAAWRF